MEFFKKEKENSGRRNIYICGMKIFSYTSNSKGATSYRNKLREEILKDNTSVLEIGPFCRPFLIGDHVCYFEIMPPNEIKSLCEEIGLDFANIPSTIDFVSRDGNLDVINKQFDKVFSSHVIEHTTDLIRHLQSIENILHDGGKYYLAIPDKRYCFDHFKSPSTLGDILEAYYNKETFIPLRTMIDRIILNTHNDSKEHWKKKYKMLEKREIDIEKIFQLINKYKEGEHNIKDDCHISHRWFLYPEQFKTIIETLKKMKLTKFNCIHIESTPKNSQEFFVILEK